MIYQFRRAESSDIPAVWTILQRVILRRKAVLTVMNVIFVMRMMWPRCHACGKRLNVLTTKNMIL